MKKKDFGYYLNSLFMRIKIKEEYMRKYLPFIILINFIIISCSTTVFKTKDQLPTGMKFFDDKEQFSLIINEDWQGYPTCEYDETIKAKNIDKGLLGKKTNIIGYYNYEKTEKNPLKMNIYHPIICQDIFYVAEVDNYGYLFIKKEIADNLKFRQENADSISKDDAENKKAREFIEKLRYLERDLFYSVTFPTISYPLMVQTISRGANVNARNYYGETPLMILAQAGADQMINYLLQHGADINAKDKKGYTVLMRAIMSTKNNISTVKILVANGANVNIRDNELGGTAYDYAKFNKRTEIMLILRSAGAK